MKRKYIAKTEIGNFKFTINENVGLNDYFIKENICDKIYNKFGKYPKFIQINEANKFGLKDRMRYAYNKYSPESMPKFEDDPIADRQEQYKITTDLRTQQVCKREAKKVMSKINDDFIEKLINKCLSKANGKIYGRKTNEYEAFSTLAGVMAQKIAEMYMQSDESKANKKSIDNNYTLFRILIKNEVLKYIDKFVRFDKENNELITFEFDRELERIRNL